MDSSGQSGSRQVCGGKICNGHTWVDRSAVEGVFDGQVGGRHIRNLHS